MEKKAAVLQQQKLPEELANPADLSKASARVTELPTPALALDRVLWETRAKALSAVLLRHPGLQRSSVTVSVQQVDELYQNSEGTRAAGPANLALVRAELSTQATDGRALRDEVAFVARRGEELPSQASIDYLDTLLVPNRHACPRARFGGPFSTPEPLDRSMLRKLPP